LPNCSDFLPSLEDYFAKRQGKIRSNVRILRGKVCWVFAESQFDQKTW
jgi:hypothetical protein